VNVDFADVRTVMSEMGMAMMGSAEASGENRAIIAAEQAVASPLLEDGHLALANARGVLVNITSSMSFKMKEFHDVMNTIKEFTADDATIIVGSVIDENLGDDLRVTMVATGLNSDATRAAPKPELKVMTAPVQREATTGEPVYMGMESNDQNMQQNDEPDVFSSNNNRRAQVKAMEESGVETYDIPAFLRKQAD